MSAVARSDIATLELANQSVHTAAQVRRELTAAGAGTASVRVKLEAEGRWTPAPTCDQRACTRSPAEKHAHVLRTARRAAADPARVGGMRPGAPQGVLARLGRAPLGFRGACALTRARRGHGKRELRAGLAPERAEVGPTVLPSEMQHSEPPRRGPCLQLREAEETRMLLAAMCKVQCAGDPLA